MATETIGILAGIVGACALLYFIWTRIEKSRNKPPSSGSGGGGGRSTGGKQVEK